LEFPKGAGSMVDEVAKEFVSQHGSGALGKVAKMHFRTSFRARDLPEPAKMEWKKADQETKGAPKKS